MKKAIKVGSLAVLYSLLLSAHGIAQELDLQNDRELPAVDGINTKFSAIGGSLDDVSAYGVSGVVAAPIGDRFGVQLDGTVARVNASSSNDMVYGGAAHLFWRDPSKGLVGLFGHVIHTDLAGGVTAYSGAVEYAYYANRVTLEGWLGATDVDVLGTDFYSDTMVSYYPTDEIKIGIGHGYSIGRNALNIAGEWSLGGQGDVAWSVFARGSLIEGGDTLAFAGLRLYVGRNQKSLLRRHREDDPPDSSPATFVIAQSTRSDIGSLGVNGENVCVGQNNC